MKIKSLIAVIISVICICTAVCVGAADNGEVQISANAVSDTKLEISVKNVCDTYIANVSLSVGDSADGKVKVKSFGLAGAERSNSAVIRSIAPGETVTVYATIEKVKPAQTTKPAHTTKPVQTTKPAQTTRPVQTTDPVVIDSVITDTYPIYTDYPDYGYDYTDYPEYTDPVTDYPYSDEDFTDTSDDDVTETDAVSKTEKTSDTEDVTEGGIIADEDTDTDSEEIETCINTIINAYVFDDGVINLTTVTDGETVGVEGDGGNAVLFVVLGIVGVVLVGVGVCLFIITAKKKKRSPNDISRVIILALIMLGLTTVTENAADAAESALDGFSDSVTFSGGSVTVTADYTVVPAPVTEPLKNLRRPAPGDDCDAPKVSKDQIVSGAGPLAQNEVYIGDNNFMFEGTEIKVFNGTTALSGARLKKVSDMLNSADSWAKSNGIKLYFVVAPSKSTVYSEYVPDSVTAADKTSADSLLEYLANNSSVEVIDLRRPLINAKSQYGDSLYYKYDTHWNNNGGFVAYSEIIRRVNEDVSGVYIHKKSDYTVSEHETYMRDLAWYLGYYSSYKDYGPVYTLKSGMTATLKYKSKLNPNGQFKYCSTWENGYSDSINYMTFENAYNTGAPTLYMYRDSYSIGMIHFLKDSFGRSTFNWNYNFNKNDVLSSGANVVIIEVVEKQLVEFSNAKFY